MRVKEIGFLFVGVVLSVIKGVLADHNFAIVTF